jgi:hypothetical protein
MRADRSPGRQASQHRGREVHGQRLESAVAGPLEGAAPESPSSVGLVVIGALQLIPTRQRQRGVVLVLRDHLTQREDARLVS